MQNGEPMPTRSGTKPANPVFPGPVDAAVRAAATVVVLRGGERGPEVLMIRRHPNSEVLAGAYVFPGGKLDTADLRVVRGGRLASPPGQLHARLGEPTLEVETAAALFVAACRETLEEAGVLFARGVDAQRAQRVREGACSEAGFAGTLEELDLRLATDSLIPWTRWITPRSPALMNRRFDARFFVAALPPGQLAVHDDFEATDSVWMRPAVALERYRVHEILLAPVQIMSLAHLARHASVESVLDEARARIPPRIEPELYEYAGLKGFAYPGHERHPVRMRAMPGPTSLVLRGERFEPPDGFDQLFGECS